MSNNLENERSVTSGKMYPIDLAPQKITIVKSVSNTEVKMAHLIPGQPKISASGQMLAHAGPVGLMRPAAQIISPGVTSQPQMIVSGSPILQGNQIVSQGSQMISQGTQILSQSQLISSSGQLISPGTQIISQGTQLSAQISSNNTGTSNVHTNVSTSISGGQVLNVGGQLVGGGGNLVVSSSVRTLPPTSVRVLSPLAHPNTRPAVLSNVNVSTTGGVLVSKSVGMTSHVPRGLAAGASLAVRQVTPSPNASQGSSTQAWSTGNRGPRGALVYGGRSGLPRPARPTTPGAVPHAALASSPALQPTLASQPQHSTVISLPSTTVLSSNSVITGALRGPSPRLPSPALGGAPLGPRPLPLLQRNYQPKVVGVASVGVRGVVGNSAPTQLYYEVPRCASAPAAPAPAPAPAPAVQTAPRLRPPYAHHALQQHQTNTVSTVTVLPETRPPTSAQTTPVVPRPSILRKRDIEGSPTKPVTVTPVQLGPATSISALPLRSPTACFRPVGGTGAGGPPGWEDVPAGGGGAGGGGGSGGSTTISASSSPAPLDEPEPDVSPRKKPRKQMLTNEVRQCEFTPEETPPTPPPVNTNPPPKRPLLSSSYVCGWRGTALHFVRPADVRRREPRASDILAIASQKHVLSAADGWKVHHLTAMMDDLVSLEADVGEQLAGVQRALETASGRVLSALKPHSHTLMELLKGNIQRSKIVCEGIQEAREDILRVFTHRNFVSEILTRQADKRCFRKHRSQS